MRSSSFVPKDKQKQSRFDFRVHRQRSRSTGKITSTSSSSSATTTSRASASGAATATPPAPTHTRYIGLRGQRQRGSRVISGEAIYDYGGVNGTPPRAKRGTGVAAVDKTQAQVHNNNTNHTLAGPTQPPVRLQESYSYDSSDSDSVGSDSDGDGLNDALEDNMGAQPNTKQQQQQRSSPDSARANVFDSKELYSTLMNMPKQAIYDSGLIMTLKPYITGDEHLPYEDDLVDYVLQKTANCANHRGIGMRYLQCTDSKDAADVYDDDDEKDTTEVYYYEHEPDDNDDIDNNDTPSKSKSILRNRNNKATSERRSAAVTEAMTATVVHVHVPQEHLHLQHVQEQQKQQEQFNSVEVLNMPPRIFRVPKRGITKIHKSLVIVASRDHE
jgi:hypothetical protein